jgi:mono/diheme cytochrome c family protein
MNPYVQPFSSFKRRFVATLTGCAIAGVLVAACGVPAPPPRTQAASAAPTGDAKRGEYLSKIFACQDCHSVTGPDGITLAPETIMSGGVPFTGPWGLVHAPNVTEMARGFNDANLSKVLRGQFVSLRVMPTKAFNLMAEQDMTDLIAYLRTLKPTPYDAPANNLNGDFSVPPLNTPLPIPVTAPTGATVARGEYLVTLAACDGCHTPTDDKGNPVDGKWLAGGSFSFQDNENRNITPPNLTPDKETGLSNWTDAQIEAALRHGKNPNGGQLYPFMPYASAFYAFTDEDVAAVIAYLRSIPPVKNEIPPNPDYKPGA